MFYTNLNQPPFESALEHKIGISATKPDEALSVREILEKHRRGMPLDVGRVMLDDDESLEEALPTHNPDYDLADAYEQVLGKRNRSIMDAYNKSKSSEASTEK